MCNAWLISASSTRNMESLNHLLENTGNSTISMIHHSNRFILLEKYWFFAICKYILKVHYSGETPKFNISSHVHTTFYDCHWIGLASYIQEWQWFMLDTKTGSIASPLQLMTQHRSREMHLPQLPSALGPKQILQVHQELIKKARKQAWKGIPRVAARHTSLGSTQAKCQGGTCNCCDSGWCAKFLLGCVHKQYRTT